jgi:hypothetical protein
MHALPGGRLLSSHVAAGGHISAGGPIAAGGHAALGGGGLGGLIIHLFIWRMIWRLGMLIWRIPAVGPELLVLIVLAVIGVGIFRSKRGLPLPWQRRGGPYGIRDRDRDGGGPRSW